MLDRARIPATWDVTIIGDGSGNGWNQPCGWASILIERETRGRQLFHGGMSQGSINLAELMPYFQALLWFHSQFGKERLRRKGLVNVHILTDSQVIATQGTWAANLQHELPKPQQPLWAAMREFCRQGYAIQFHWGERCDSALNWTADLIAGLCRREVINAGLDTATSDTLSQRAAAGVGNVQFKDPLTGDPISVYSINPETAS